MPDPRHLLNGGGAPGQRQVVYARVSTLQPAPGAFTDPLFITLPYDPDRSIKIENWPVIHGATLPALGADALLVFDDLGNPRVVWWDGIHS